MRGARASRRNSSSPASASRCRRAISASTWSASSPSRNTRPPRPSLSRETTATWRSRPDPVDHATSPLGQLGPARRSFVLLTDVLGQSLEEIGGLLELSPPAVKAALYRGRVRLRELAMTQLREPPRRLPSPAVARYVALFNARDWDGVRALLAEDVQLDLVSRAQRAGRAVGDYLTNYDRYRDWRPAPARPAGPQANAAVPAPGRTRPGYFS